MIGSISIEHEQRDFEIADLYSNAWENANETVADRYWNGSIAEEGRQFRVGMLWSDADFKVRFEAKQNELLVINNQPILDSKTKYLWERDVCEIFIAPDRNEPRKYFEFEVAPTGEWLDLAIDSTSGDRVTDWDYRSGIETAATIEEGRVVMAMKIPWHTFGNKPEPGDIWLGNVFRCVGREPDRGYLAWQPTFTEKPDFHLPETFGQFFFVK